MSIVDTSFADPISNLSPWEQLRSRLFAEREIAADALRQELATRTVSPRTAAELRLDLAKFNRWLEVPTVQSTVEFGNWVRARKADTLRQLAALTMDGAA